MVRDLPGGVVDVSSPLEERWTWSGAVGPGRVSTDVAVLGGVLAFESDGGVVALDPATGDEVWSVPLREHVLRAKRVGPVSAIDLGDATCTAGGECTRTIGGAWGSSDTRLELSGQLAPDTFGARFTADLIGLNGCGVQAAVTPDGVVLGMEFAPGEGRVASFGAAGYVGTSFHRWETPLWSRQDPGTCAGWSSRRARCAGSGTVRTQRRERRRVLRQRARGPGLHRR